MKNNFATFLVAILPFYNLCQENNFNRGGQFSLGTEIGLVSSKSTLQSGNVQLITSPLLAQTFNIRYRYRFTDKLYSSLGGGLGYINFKFKYPTYDFSNNFSSLYYQLDIHSAYSILTRTRSSLNLKLGTGVSKYDETVGSYSIERENDKSYLTYFNSTSPHFFFQLGTEYVLKTKKMNEWAFSLSYRYEFQSNRTGSWSYYSIANGSGSIGRFNQSNSGFRFGIDYTFTRVRKKETYAKAAENGQSKKAYKKEKRLKNRYINPKGQRISLYTGFGLMETTIKTNNPYYRNGFEPSFVPEISYELGIRSNFFFETSLNYNEMQRKIIFSNNGQKAYQSIGGFSLFMLTTGVNYKVQLPKTRLQIVNLHTGIGIGFRTSNQFPNEFEQEYNTQIVNQTFIHSVSGKVIPVLYLGLSKDIRLKEHWSLNLQYKKQFGLNTIVQTDIYYQLPNSSETMYAKGILNGTGHLFRLGLTYHLPQKDK